MAILPGHGSETGVTSFSVISCYLLVRHHDGNMKMEDIVDRALKFKLWRYRSEGNGNIVVALTEAGKILRLVKSTPPDGNSQSVLLHEDTTRLRQLLTFVKTMVVPRLGTRFAHSGEVVKISETAVSELNDDIMAQRPVERTNKCLRVTDCYALLLPDQCFLPVNWKLDSSKLQGPTWTVEIKPKMGFLPTYYRAENERYVCKFSLKQKLKMKQGKINEISGYCPIDLFSGCPLRMMDAFQSLLQTPQNNLLIFKNGQLVFGGKCGKNNAIIDELLSSFDPNDIGHSTAKSRKIRDWCSLIVEILLRHHTLNDAQISPQEDSFQKQNCRCQDNRTRKKPVACECQSCHLQPSSVLGRLLSMQLLGDIEVKTVSETYKKVLEKFGNSSRLDQLLYNGDVADAERVQVDEDLCLKRVRNFLLSCTAKDCSLMITYQQMSTENIDLPVDDNRIVSSASGLKFVYNVAFVDLDWKSHTRIPKMVEEEKEIIEANI